MSKAFEKILERLEELQNYACFPTEWVNEEQSKIHSYYADKLTEILKLTKQYNNDWIPCSERLPEEYGEYLVWWTDITREQYYEIVEYEPGNGWIGEIPQAFEGKYSVIAWQPLPEPFNERD